MMPRDPRLLVQPAPLLKRPMNTGQAMRDVSLALGRSVYPRIPLIQQPYSWLLRRQLSLSEADIALDGLPGLASDGGFAAFNVRGRGPRDNLVFVDNFPLDKVVHFDQTLGEEEDIGGGGRQNSF